MSNFKSPAVFLAGNQPRTLSTDIAAFFSKSHHHVLRDIRNLMADCPDDFIKSNFGFIRKTAELGHAQRQDPAYSLTKDGFTLLAMGFTGPKALKFKLAYIEAFNKMEVELARRMPADRMPAAPSPALTAAPADLNDLVHMGSAIDYSRTLRQMARLKNYSPAQRLGFLAEAASVLSGRPADQLLPEEFDPAYTPPIVRLSSRDREKQTRQDAQTLAAKIEAREREGLPRLPVSKAGTMLFRWGTRRTARATGYALENGLLQAVEKTTGNGWQLAPLEGRANGQEG